MRSSTQNYKVGSNKEQEDNSHEFLELSGSKNKKAEGGGKVDEDDAFLMYCNHLYFKKERDEIDRQLIDDIHLKLVE